MAIYIITRRLWGFLNSAAISGRLAKKGSHAVMFELGSDQYEKVWLVDLRVDGKDMIDGKNNKHKGLKYVKG